MEKTKAALDDLLSSKKFWLTLCGILIVVLRNRLGLTDTDMMAISALVGTGNIGFGLADHGKEAAKQRVKKPASDIDGQ